jgi:exodeoxyribonuclease VII large subunit
MATQITLADLQSGLLQMNQILIGRMQDSFLTHRETLGWLEGRLRVASPYRRIQGENQRLDDIAHRLRAAQIQNLAWRAAHLSGMENRLLALSPLSVLQRGYAVVSRKIDGLTVTKTTDISPGDDLSVLVKDGKFDARVTE